MKHIQLYEDITGSPKTTLVIFGLPGSGKTKLAEEIQRQEPEMEWQHYDDYSLKKAKEAMGKENQIISDGMVMLDPESSRGELTSEARRRGSLIRFIYFENSPEQCKANVKRRAKVGDIKSHQRVGPEGTFLKQIDGLSAGYEIPKGETPIEVWNPTRES